MYFLCCRHNAICTERVNFVVKTYLVVFKILFSISKLNITKILALQLCVECDKLVSLKSITIYSTPHSKSEHQMNI